MTVIAATKLKMLAPWKASNDKPRQSIKKQRHHFVDKGLCSQNYDFSRIFIGRTDAEAEAPVFWPPNAKS